MTESEVTKLGDGYDDFWIKVARGTLSLINSGELQQLRDLKQDVIGGIFRAQWYQDLIPALTNSQRHAGSNAMLDAYRKIGLSMDEIGHGAAVLKNHAPRHVAEWAFQWIQDGNIDELRNARYALMWEYARAHALSAIYPTLTDAQKSIVERDDLPVEERSEIYRRSAAQRMELKAESGLVGLVRGLFGARGKGA
ncbi:MAG: hypothetical protein ACRECD_04195 [Burkholderiaceae bacterium]